MVYTKKFKKTYADGYKDRPNTSTPVTAAIKNMETEALLSIEEYLANNDIPSVSVSRELMSGTHIADITVNGTKYSIYAPSQGTSGSNVSYSAEQTEGTLLGTLTIDNTPYKIYAPAGSGDSVTVDSELSAESENPVQNKVIAAKLNEVFQSVSDGKSLIASAITDKGVTTEADATFQTMAANIWKISGGGSVSASNAIEMTGISIFKSKIALADTLSMDQIILTKDSTDIEVTTIEKISDTKFKLTADFSGISAGDSIKIQTAKGFLYDPDLTSLSNVAVKMYDERFLVEEPKLDGTANLTLLYNQAGSGYYATKRAEQAEKYWAIGLITYCGVYTVPLIVSDVSDYACVTSTYMGNSPTSTYTFEYDGKTYYCNSNVQGAYQSSVAISNASIPLYDVHDSNYTDNEAGCVYMAKKLLDFYFGKAGFPT